MLSDLTIPSPRKVGPNTAYSAASETRRTPPSKPRKRVQHVRFAIFLNNIMEEGTEFGTNQFRSDISHRLNQALMIEFRCQSGPTRFRSSAVCLASFSRTSSRSRSSSASLRSVMSKVAPMMWKHAHARSEQLALGLKASVGPPGTNGPELQP